MKVGGDMHTMRLGVVMMGGGEHHAAPPTFVLQKGMGMAYTHQ
jgi:hypothetical protein